MDLDLDLSLAEWLGLSLCLRLGRLLHGGRGRSCGL